MPKRPSWAVSLLGPAAPGLGHRVVAGISVRDAPVEIDVPENTPARAFRAFEDRDPPLVLENLQIVPWRYLKLIAQFLGECHLTFRAQDGHGRMLYWVG